MRPTFALALAILLLVPATSNASTFDVDTTGDGGDSNLGDGVCLSRAVGCTLRAAVEEINSEAKPGIVNVPRGVYTLLSADGGAIEITSDLTISGVSARSTRVESEVDSSTGDGLDRVFDVTGLSTQVTIQGVTVRLGRASDANGCFGGNIRSEGILTLREDLITAGQACSGGGLANVAGRMTVLSSTISDNRANSGGSDSGAIQNFGTDAREATLSITNTTISGNSALLGGGIFSWRDPSTSQPNQDRVTIANSTISDNDSGTRGGGGGIASTAASVFTLVNTIVAGNRNIADASQPNCSTEVP